MSSIDVLATRRKLTNRGLCPNSNPEVAAEFLDEMLDEALDSYVTDVTLRGVVEQWRAERAEIAAQQAQFLADIRLEMNEIRKEISDFREENNLRERERDERERQRDERERQHIRDQEDRDAKMRQWVIGAVGIGFAAATLVTGLLAAFG